MTWYIPEYKYKIKLTRKYYPIYNFPWFYPIMLVIFFRSLQLFSIIDELSMWPHINDWFSRKIVQFVFFLKCICNSDIQSYDLIQIIDQQKYTSSWLREIVSNVIINIMFHVVSQIISSYHIIMSHWLLRKQVLQSTWTLQKLRC